MAPKAHRKTALVQKALAYAESAHKGQKRASGEPYINHPKAVAEILRNDLHADEETIAAALLHDTVEDTKITTADIKREFGEAVARLVEGVTKVQKTERDLPAQERSFAAIRKIFQVMGSDIRVIFIKLADRLHNMQTLEHLKKEKQQRIARETQEIYCPITDLLGIRKWHEDLMNLSVQYLDPPGYALLSQKAQKAEAAATTLTHWAEHLQKEFRKQGFTGVCITLRKRHLEEVRRRAGQQISLLSLPETHYSMHVLCEDEKYCYPILGAIHAQAVALPDHFHDFIASSKINGYQALHTTVISPLGDPIVVTVQCREMDLVARFGMALPYQWPKQDRPWKSLPQWVRKLLSIERSAQGQSELFQVLQEELFGQRRTVHIAGRKVKTIDLPANATLLDAAFHFHPSTADRTTGASVHGQECSLRCSVHTGDVINFHMQKSGSARSAADLPFLRTSMGQKRLLHLLQRRGGQEQKKEGIRLLSMVLDIAVDPFLPTQIRRTLQQRIEKETDVLKDIGTGLRNPFDVLEEYCKPEEIFLVDPRCFTIGAHLKPGQKIRFILQAHIEDLHTKKTIGVHTRPDVIDIIRIPEPGKDATRDPSKELVPLDIRNTDLLRHPFAFGLRWTFAKDSEPLSVIARIQSILDTPVELAEFDRTSATLVFHASHIVTLRSAYEFLVRDPGVDHIVRISP